MALSILPILHCACKLDMQVSPGRFRTGNLQSPIYLKEFPTGMMFSESFSKMTLSLAFSSSGPLKACKGL